MTRLDFDPYRSTDSDGLAPTQTTEAIYPIYTSVYKHTEFVAFVH